MDLLDAINLETHDHVQAVFSAVTNLSDVPFIIDIGRREEGLDAVEDLLAAAMNEFGAVVFFQLPEVQTHMKDLSGPQRRFLLQAKIMVDPNFDVNNARPTITELLDALLAAVHQWTPSAINTCFIPEDKAVPQESDGLLWLVQKFQNTAGFGVGVSQVQTPVVSVNAGQLTIECGTAGASIFYTTDGRMPTPRRGTLYTASVSGITSGTQIKARAWLPGYGGSQVGKAVA